MSILENFLTSAETDPRIAPVHITLFVAIWHIWNARGQPKKIEVFNRELKPICKIASSSTFRKSIRELSEFGYLNYEPSFNHFKGSSIRFTKSV